MEYSKEFQVGFNFVMTYYYLDHIDLEEIKTFVDMSKDFNTNTDFDKGAEKAISIVEENISNKKLLDKLNKEFEDERTL